MWLVLQLHSELDWGTVIKKEINNSQNQTKNQTKQQPNQNAKELKIKHKQKKHTKISAHPIHTLSHFPEIHCNLIQLLMVFLSSVSRALCLNCVSYDKKWFLCEVNDCGSCSQNVICLGSQDH